MNIAAFHSFLLPAFEVFDVEESLLDAFGELSELQKQEEVVVRGFFLNAHDVLPQLHSTWTIRVHLYVENVEVELIPAVLFVTVNKYLEERSIMVGPAKVEDDVVVACGFYLIEAGQINFLHSKSVKEVQANSDPSSK